MTHHLFVGRRAAGNVVLTHDGFHTRPPEQGGRKKREKKRKERESETGREREREKNEDEEVCTCKRESGWVVLFFIFFF